MTAFRVWLCIKNIMNYKNYLKSDGWEYAKKKLSNFYNKKECFVCQSKDNIQTHHKTYKRIGNEDIYKDLVFVCNKCHLKINELKKEYNSNYWNATEMFKKRYIKNNGFRWGKFEIAQYFKNNKIPSKKYIKYI